MLRALLIDDDDDFLAGLTEIAEQEGFAVATAGSLKAARDHLSREPVDIANAILFLVSADASWITGHLLMVDGGFSAGQGLL